MTAPRLARSILLGSLLCGLSFSTASPSVAASCGSEIQGGGIVSAIIDARTLRLDDGRDVRLAGVEVVAGDANDHRPALAALIGRQVILRGDGDDPDRYGRQSAFVYLDPSARSIQSELLERGEALASGDIADKACAAELATAEAAARQARRGTWANSSIIKNVENPVDILTRVGQFTVVEGKVLSVRQAGGTIYVNFGRRWTRDFAATISRRMIPYFEAAGIAPVSLENRRVRVRGWVERRGGPRINVLRVGQIEVIGD
ncbi:thermonuclease family protein [Nitrobacter sp.]|uniref:thermonuclease family protein n=1 Tax=Nitrobacter sp. TaxID=29420 RepID=UPI00399D68D1